MNRARFLLLVLLIAVLGVETHAQYWDVPQKLSSGGRFPSYFSTKDGPLLVWEESNEKSSWGQIFLRYAWQRRGDWVINDVVKQSYNFVPISGGIPPQISTAVQGPNGEIMLAVSATGTTVDIFRLRSAAEGFIRLAKITVDVNSTGPRIFPMHDGGWMLFLTRGHAIGTSVPATATGQAQEAASTTLNVYFATSPDGEKWTAFAPLASGSEITGASLSPAMASQGAKDVVVFQAQNQKAGTSTGRYDLVMRSVENGRWSNVTTLTLFSEGNSTYQDFDNQKPRMLSTPSNLFVAWERRNLRTLETQVYAAILEPAGSLSQPTRVTPSTRSWILADTFEIQGSPGVISIEDSPRDNQVSYAYRDNYVWKSLDLGFGRLAARGSYTAFVRGQEFSRRTAVFWEQDQGNTSTLLFAPPITSVASPTLRGLNFVPGQMTRTESFSIGIEMPPSRTNIVGYSYLWTSASQQQNLTDVWSKGTKMSPGIATLYLPASSDGLWKLWVSVEDQAGNRSTPAVIGAYRKLSPPPAPTIADLPRDSKGFLDSNTFALHWSDPAPEDLSGYTWALTYLGDLRAIPVLVGSMARLADSASIEANLAATAGNIALSPGVLSSAPTTSYTNIEDGYYLFSVAAIDQAGNISQASRITFRANKYIPSTIITAIDSSLDAAGDTALSIAGKGFLAGGSITSIVIDRDSKPPYDVSFSLANLDYRILSDTSIGGFSLGDLPTGQYHVGLDHSARGWYWSDRVLSMDSSRTVKFGVTSDYDPEWMGIGGSQPFISPLSILNILLLLLAATGIFALGRRALLVARESHIIRLETYALISGGPMPKTEALKAALALKKRGVTLRTKFSLTIIALIVLVVLMLSTLLANSMVRSTRYELARGLDQKAKVLLESIAMGSRFFLGSENAVTQLSFLPSQAKAMNDAVYVTITGNALDPSLARRDVVFASNDPTITAKMEGSSLAQGSILSLGKSYFDPAGTDPLSSKISEIAAQLDRAAAAILQGEYQLKVRLNQEKTSLPNSPAGTTRRSQINQDLDKVDLDIRNKLFSLSNASIGIIPSFDPATFRGKIQNLLYYKPVLEYRPGDANVYRGMVRLEVQTNLIVSQTNAAITDLVRIALLVAAAALIIGIVGASILSAVTVGPIRKLVAQIEHIRDTEDKESLVGSSITVKSKDELYTLATAVNQMTDGLVKAAKANKELMVGKGIQRMFIPLDSIKGSSAKLATGSLDSKDFEIFGYYEGAKGVSGDYWDFRTINERYHYFIKCDISGKGVSAALIMVQVATMVINYFAEWKKAMPARFDLSVLAYKINDFIEERGFIGRFAAFTLGLWDAKQGVAYLVVAGDLKLHIWDSSEGKLVEVLMAPSIEKCPPAAGIFPSMLVEMKQPYVQITQKIDHGDALLLYTDGIEEAKRLFRDRDFRIITCADVEKDQAHGNHSGGVDNEEFGYSRISDLLMALGARSTFELTKWHDPTPEKIMTFNFEKAEGSLAEMVVALAAVEKVFRLYFSPAATDQDYVVVDQAVDGFLAKYFDQYGLYCSHKSIPDPSKVSDAGYFQYSGINEDDQYDDLTILAIKRK